MGVLVAQSCPTLCNPINCSPPCPSVHGILQARTLELVAISFFKRNYRKKVKSLNRVRLFATPWIVAYQAPPSMEFSRQEYWSGLPFPSPVIYYKQSQKKKQFFTENRTLVWEENLTTKPPSLILITSNTSYVSSTPSQ